MRIKLDPDVQKELEYVVDLHKRYGAPKQMDSVDDLVAYVLRCIADGSLRPGAWQRQMLYALGLVAETMEHEIQRDDYGPSKAN